MTISISNNSYFKSIYGAIYSGLPQKEYAFVLYSSKNGFAKPKSAILICPSIAIIKF
jgi:hypothetical protein